MSLLTNLVRMHLTSSFKGFIFTNEYDNILPYEDCKDLGLYIHIPFCSKVCNFCPYCKEKYSKKKCDLYIDYLIKEIHKVGSSYKGKKDITSLYFGGGSPALAINRLKDIIEEVNKYFIINEGIGIELHPSNLSISNLKKLKEIGVSKISIGIQSFQNKFQKILGREGVDPNKVKEILDEIRFETVSMDFIFALPNQTFEDLKKDIDMAFEIGANHIAIYPFINFSFANNNIKLMGKREKKKLLDQITLYCLSKGYKRTSIWTFAKEDRASYSSMTRDNFLGFGCSATSLLKDQFKINTFSVEEYIKRVEENLLPTSLTIRFTKKQRMIYWLFWRLYTMRVNVKDFEDFFGVSLEKVYGIELRLAQLLGFASKEDNFYSMTMKGAFYYHHYENYYTLSYIDKMWGIMSKEAFPKSIKL